MVDVYVTEPPTNGKVLLVTSAGDFDIELWPKEAPKACRNFVQLCMEGYYNGCLFHRVVPGFMAQTGDPTNTGEGGDSIYGEPFKDEFHSRLKFNHRGLVAMANAGPNNNSSQFFITLDKCDFLNKKHTIFGRVSGKTIFNVPTLGEGEMGADDRPLHPHKILRTEILNNPFDDIVPRASLAVKADVKQDTKPKPKGAKNLSLLSFGDEEAAEEQALTRGGIKAKIVSSHDVLSDPRLSNVPVMEPSELVSKPKAGAGGADDIPSAEHQAKIQELKQMAREQLRRPKGKDAEPSAVTEKSSKQRSAAVPDDDDDDGGDGDEHAGGGSSFDLMMRERVLQKRGGTVPAAGGSSSTGTKAALTSQPTTELEGEVDKVKQELLEVRRRRREKTEELKNQSSAFNLKQAIGSADNSVDNVLTPLEQRRQKYLKRKRATSKRSDDTLSKLQAFQKTLKAAKQVGGGSASADAAPVRSKPVTKETVGSLVDDYENEVDEDGLGWMAHKVKFMKRPQDYDPMARNQESYEYTLFDPLAPEAKDALGVLPARSRVLASSSGGIGFKSMLAEADDKPKLDLMAYASSSEDEQDPAVDQDPAQPAAQPSVIVAASERTAAAAESKVSKPLGRRSRSPSPRGNGKRDRSNRDDHRRRSRSRSRSNDRHRGGSSRHRSKRSKSRSRSPRDRRDRRRVSRSPSRSRSRSKDRRRRS